jgi:hypothetical protein
MDFNEAVDAVCASFDHEDVAHALGVSVQTVRQARLKRDAIARRKPPADWQHAIIRLAERRMMRDRKLIEDLRAQG